MVTMSVTWCVDKTMINILFFNADTENILPATLHLQLRYQFKFPYLQALDWPEGFSLTKAKTQYKEKLNSLELTRDQKDSIISIKMKVFQLNNKLIKEVTHSKQSKDVAWKYLERILFVLCLISAFLLFWYMRK